MGVTRAYNHRLRLRNTLPSSTKVRLQIFPILNCLLFAGMLLHTGMHFLMYKYYFYRWVEAGGSLCGSLCCARCLAAVRTAAVLGASMGGRSQPFSQGCCWSPNKRQPDTQSWRSLHQLMCMNVPDTNSPLD